MQENGALGLRVRPEDKVPRGLAICALHIGTASCYVSFSYLSSAVDLLLYCLLILEDRSGESWNRWVLPFILMYSKPLDSRKKREDELAVAVKYLALA